MGRLFGEYIRSKREALLESDPRFSIRRVAERIRVHHSYLSKIERGEPGTLSEQKIVALAKELGEAPELLLAMNGRVSRTVAQAAMRNPKEFGELLDLLKAQCGGGDTENEAACSDMLRRVNALLLGGGSPVARHDMRANIAEIVSAAAAVLEAGNLKGDALTLVRGIHERATRLIGSLDDSLALEALDAGAEQMRMHPVDMLALAESVRDDLSEMAQLRGVRLRLRLDGVELDKGRVEVVASEHMCRSILTNLVRNAVEAAPEGEDVTIRLCGGDSCTMEIHNQGVVPVEIRGSFFDRFVTAGKSGGVGIGTYAAKRMTEALGGRLHMETSEEDGTTLRLTLPVLH